NFSALRAEVKRLTLHTSDSSKSGRESKDSCSSLTLSFLRSCCYRCLICLSGDRRFPSRPRHRIRQRDSSSPASSPLGGGQAVRVCPTSPRGRWTRSPPP